MNIILSCYANKGKASFVLEKSGRVIDKEVFSVPLDDKVYLKEFIFEAIIRGLKSARNVVEHEDLLLIGVQNNHVADWLNGHKEVKDYAYYLDDIFKIIDTMDCRYRFSCTSVAKAKKALEEGVSKVKLDSAVSLFKDM